MIWYTWEKKKCKAVWKNRSIQAESWASLHLPTSLHITYTKRCIIPFQYCETPYIPGQGGGSWAKMHPPSRSTRKVVPWEGLSLLERRHAQFAVFICIKNALLMHCASRCLCCAIDGSPFFPSVGNRREQPTSSPEYKEPGGLYYRRPLHHCLSGTRALTAPPHKHFCNPGRTHF